MQTQVQHDLYLLLAVKVEIRYDFFPASKMYQARITVVLPAVEKLIQKEYQSPEKFLGETLSPEWGYLYGESERLNRFDLEASSLEELQKKETEILQTWKKELLRIVSFNTSQLREVPPPKNLNLLEC